jgi:alkylation response protein AidB-like acyl-CoA dehydrogenase
MNLDYTDEQEQLVTSFERFFSTECPPARVRAAEPLGFDLGLWVDFAGLGGVGISVRTDRGGGGGSLLDHAIVAGLWGSHLAPIPLAEAVATARLLDRIDAFDDSYCSDWRDKLLTGEAILTLPIGDRPNARSGRLLPAGAIASGVLLERDGATRLIELNGDNGKRLRANLGATPWGEIEGLDAGKVLVSDPRTVEWMRLAALDWKVLMANSLAGLAARALEIAVLYTSERIQFGVPIATFQTIAHRLADIKTEVDGAQLLALEAAWAADNDPTQYRKLASMSFAYCTEVARHATAESLHFHGGYGFMTEFDIQLYFRRAKTWPLIAGGPKHEYVNVADIVLEKRRAEKVLVDCGL